jgi:asparagine synthase (glutamine-hydrolysing)
MCGIYGTINYNVEPEFFRMQLDKLEHRGPDGAGIYISNNKLVNLGHRRLAIIDTDARANQPMHVDNRYWIVFNGEIYNYIEIRKELENAGITFNTNSDTEVLLKLIILKGPSALSSLNGMWSFVIYDEVEKTFLLSRDRIGKKPLYYIWENEKFAFSSEMKNLGVYLKNFQYNKPFIDFSVNHVNDNEVLDETIICGIKKFPAGSYGVFKEGHLTIERYYCPEKLLEKKCEVKNYNEAVERFRELFESSCKLRMRSDVPVGSALSGGIDSGLVVSTLAKLGFTNTNNYRTLVSSFPGSFLDETTDAKFIAMHAGIGVEAVEVIPHSDPNHILKAIYQFEEIAGTSPIPFFQLYEGFRKRNVFVTMDGHGSDELFGGYSFDLYPKLRDDFPNIFQMRTTLDTIDKMYGQQNSISLLQTLPHFKGELLKKIRQKDRFLLFDKEQHFKEQLFYSTFKGILPTLLRNYDKYSMYAGVEVRMPFLDYRIIEFAFSLPNSYKFRNGFSKAIVRKAARGIVPDHILNNKIKTGWNSPMGEWFAGPWKQWLMDEIHSIDFNNCDLVDRQYILKRVNQFYSNEQEHSSGQELWLQLQPYLIEKANRQFI